MKLFLAKCIIIFQVKGTRTQELFLLCNFRSYDRNVLPVQCVLIIMRGFTIRFPVTHFNVLGKMSPCPRQKKRPAGNYDTWSGKYTLDTMTFG